MGSLPPVTMRTRDLALTLATSTLLLVGLTGCSDDPPPSPAASPSESSGSAGSAEPSPSESAEPTEPAVEPATGPVVSTPAGSLRVPEKWTTTGSELFTDAERAPDRGRDITKDVYGFIGVDAETAESMTLDEAAREAGRMTTTDGKRVADAELDGEPVFVITESTAFGNTEYTTGAWRDGRLVVIDIALLGAEKKDRTELVESVLASWRWK